MTAPAPKILFLITKSNLGGAQKYVLELAVAAKAEGAQVLVVVGGTGERQAGLGLLATRLEEAGIKVLPIKHFMRDMSLKDDVLAMYEVWQLLRRERPDILHVTSSKAGGIGALAGRLAKTPRIIFTSHGLTMDETWRPLWQQLLITFGTWITLALAHISIMINTETYERASKMVGMKDKVVLIKNGIAPINFLDKETARTALSLSIPTGHTLIGGIGELHPNKNWVSAINMLSSFPNTIHLAIIGTGEEHEQLKRQVEMLRLTNRVHLLGYVQNAATYLKAFDIFLLPSKKEGLPYVLLEAGLAELAVVASDLPGNRDIIESGEEGFLVGPEPRLLATPLEMLLRDEGMRRRLGSALHARVTKEFSIKRMTDETFVIYSSRPLAS